MNIEKIIFRKMDELDSEDVIVLVGSTMNAEEEQFARKTIDFHFFCLRNGMDDGRHYFVAELDGKIIGIIGSHKYSWGPQDVFWGGWFAVENAYQRSGVGRFLVKNLVAYYKKEGNYRRVFIETYSSDEFAKARNFYEKLGFKQVGSVKSYMHEDVDMIVYSRSFKEILDDLAL